ncbi:hypothetical protein OH492_07300 [Vibrio chagasii]|nr:hypothetical protein [Vibrio chagasii]
MAPATSMISPWVMITRSPNLRCPFSFRQASVDSANVKAVFGFCLKVDRGYASIQGSIGLAFLRYARCAGRKVLQHWRHHQSSAPRLSQRISPPLMPSMWLAE